MEAIRKQVVLLANSNHNLKQLIRQEFEIAFNREGINCEAGSTLLTQLGNLSELCDSIKRRLGDIEVCIKLAEDAEKELSNEREQTEETLSETGKLL